MGGYFSGRRNGGPVVEDGWKLDLAHCIRQGMIRPGLYVAGTMKWTLTRSGEVTANISYVGNLVDPADAWVRLIYTSTTRATGAKVDNDYRVRLETTRPNFGGLLWWFLCPVTGRRARVLYLPGRGGTVFASRQAWGAGVSFAAGVARGSGRRAATADAPAAGGGYPRVPRDADALHGAAVAWNAVVIDRFSLGAEISSAIQSI